MIPDKSSFWIGSFAQKVSERLGDIPLLVVPKSGVAIQDLDSLGTKAILVVERLLSKPMHKSLKVNSSGQNPEFHEL